MSIHADLGIPTNRLVYSVEQQIAAGTEPQEDRASLKTLFEQIRNEGGQLRSAFQNSLSDTRMKFAQVARGSLNQYLSTPIKSDTEDVQRIMKDAFEKYSDHLLPTREWGLASAWCSQIILDSTLIVGQTKIAAVVRKMLVAGKRRLKEDHFKVGRSSSGIFEFVFIVDGSVNLDPLAYVLGKHLESEEFVQRVECSRDALHTVLLSAGESEPKSDLWDSTLYLGEIRGNETLIMEEAARAFDTLMKEFNLHELSLWGKKLSVSSTDRFMIRMRTIPNQKLLSEVVKWLSLSASDTLRRGVMENGALIAKEIVA